MTLLARYDVILIVIALLIGIVVAFWLFRGRRAGTEIPKVDTPARARVSDGPQGNAVTDEFAAATRDVAGEIFGVEAQPFASGPAGPPDDLQRLKGVGPKLVAQLNANGITRYDQLARLTPNEVEILDSRMGAFSGRIARDRLVEQACYLERGDTDGFEATFGKLGG